MITTAMELNGKANMHIFAEQCDECGLPVDGWAPPTFMVTANKKATLIGAATLTAGSFRIIGSRVDTCFVSEVVKKQKHRQSFSKDFDRLARKLIEKLKIQSDPLRERGVRPRRLGTRAMRGRK